MRAREYYKSTRMVDTMNWTLDMAMRFAEEYHKNEMEALHIHDVSQRSELLKTFTIWLDDKVRDDEELTELVNEFLKGFNCG
jgi:hypothetical protein